MYTFYDLFYCLAHVNENIRQQCWTRSSVAANEPRQWLARPGSVSHRRVYKFTTSSHKDSLRFAGSIFALSCQHYSAAWRASSVERARTYIRIHGRETKRLINNNHKRGLRRTTTGWEEETMIIGARERGKTGEMNGGSRNGVAYNAQIKKQLLYILVVAVIFDDANGARAAVVLWRDTNLSRKICRGKMLMRISREFLSTAHSIVLIPLSI